MGIGQAFTILAEQGAEIIGSGTTRKIEGGREVMYLTIVLRSDERTFRTALSRMQQSVRTSLGIQEINLHEVMGRYSADVKDMTPEEKTTLRGRPHRASLVERAIVFCSTRTKNDVQKLLQGEWGIKITRVHEMRRPERVYEGDRLLGDFGLWNIKVQDLTREQRAALEDILNMEPELHWQMGSKTTVLKDGNIVTLDRLDRNLVDTCGERLLQRDFGPQGTVIKTHGSVQST